jgi:nucleotide-binding universal stress UspA family protein
MGVIVVATDGSEAASLALTHAIELARETGDEIAVITAWQALQGDFGLVFPPTAPLEQLLDAERLHAEATLDEARRQVEEAGVSVRTRLAAGDPADVICAYADEVEARMIAMGTHGHGRVMKLLVGSVSAAVVRQAGRPVLVVPSSSPQQPNRMRHAVAAR